MDRRRKKGTWGVVMGFSKVRRHGGGRVQVYGNVAQKGATVGYFRCFGVGYRAMRASGLGAAHYLRVQGCYWFDSCLRLLDGRQSLV